MRIHLLSCLLLTFCHHIIISQTGPGGVGNSTNNVLWLDPTFGVYSNAGTTLAVNNDNVQQWNDRSGNGRNASQGTAGNRPNYITNSLNGLPTIRYTATNADRLTSTAVTTSNQASVWMVASYVSLPSSNPGLIQATPTGLSATTAAGDKSIGMWVSNAAGTRVWGRGIQSNNTQRDLSQVTTLNVNTTYIINNVYRTNRIDQYVNNQAAGNNTSHNGTLKSWTDISIGRQSNESWNGNIAELIFYNNEVNSAQRIIIDNYLAAKYGLTLGLNDVYLQDNVGNGDYDFEVAGIGQVDATNLHADAQGTGIVRILNPTNLNDNEFLLWGHNNGVAGAVHYTDIPSSVDARFDRVWRVSEVNASGASVDVGGVDMRWNLNGLGPITVTDLRLLVDTDNDGLFADETPKGGAIDLGGGIYEFSNVTELTDNLRFTIATINSVQTPLPIELVSFDAKPTDNSVLVTWQTASEINNDYFTIEKSIDGENWTVVGEQDGAGNSTSLLSYQFLDRMPSNGLSFYRLKQTDFDGHFSYSDVKTVRFELPVSYIRVNPNPSNDFITVYSVLLHDKTPQILAINGQNVTAFCTLTHLNSASMSIDLRNLSAGVYILSLGNQQIRIIKN
jgi:hypothetical protein